VSASHAKFLNQSIEICTDTDEVADKLMNHALITHLFAMAKDNLNTEVTAVTVEALSSVAATSQQNVVLLRSLGLVPILASLLYEENSYILESTIWTIGNIAGDSRDARDDVVKAGVIPRLLQIVESQKRIALIRTAAWAISNLVRGGHILEEVRDLILDILKEQADASNLHLLP
jgi:hypothetical protein